jgi:WD40 repeat protein/class 3 adenylate cyclase
LARTHNRRRMPVSGPRPSSSVRARKLPQSDRSSAVRTFLISDIRGYTRFTQEHGDEAAARLAEKFAELAEEGVEAWGGRLLEVRGDEALAVFDSTRRAIRAAVELQSAFEDETAAGPSFPLLVGMGIDAGEAVPVGEGYRGGALNLAARLCSQAEAGEILATREAVHLARRVDGIRYEPVGARVLKGLDQSIQLIRVMPVPTTTRRPEGPPSAEPREERAELPPELDAVTPLIDREADLRWLRWGWRRARHGHGRAVFLAGPSGIGKTRLAAELAREVSSQGADVLYAGCAGPAEAAEEVLRQGRSRAGPLLLVADDLDVAGGTILSFAGRLIQGLEGRSVLIVGTLRSDRSRALAPILERAGHRDDVVRRLAPLDAEGVREILALHAGRAATRLVVEDVLQETGGLPGVVHRFAGDWVRERAATSLGTSTKRAARGRRGLRSAEAQVARDVIGLQVAWDRGRLFGPETEEPSTAEPAQALCPFKGLATFEATDAEYFFGRERLVAETVARLVGASFLGVVGPSGSGKSSAVRAGLIPALASGVLPGSDRWPLVVMRPGEHPVAELHHVLRPLVPGRSRARGGSDQDPIRGALEGVGDERRLVLLVDQFEELFTTCRDEGERVAFVRALVRLARDQAGRAVVIAAVRADFYGRCAAYPELADLLGSNQVLVGPMTAEELRRAIVLPARRVGLRVEPDLVDGLVRDVVDEPGGLPLLSTTLLELWQRRSGRTMTAASYVESGGVRGAVARLAERAYGGLSPDQQAMARAVLLRLAGPGEGQAAVRRRVPLTEFDVERNEAAARVLDVLTEARLLTAGDGSVEVSHEALLREWPRLRTWLEEDAQGRRLRLHLTRSARDWDERGRDPADLYRGARLVSALDWSVDHGVELNELERTFLEDSRAASEREVEHQRRINRRLRGLLAGVAVFLVVALVAGAVAVVQGGRASRQATLTRARELANAADVNLSVDPERSILLALEAIETTRSVDGTVLPAAEAALHHAVLALRLIRTTPPLYLFDQPGVRKAGQAADYGPDGRLAVHMSDGEVRSFKGSGIQSNWVLAGGALSDLDHRPDGTLVATAGEEGAALWDPVSGERVRWLGRANRPAMAAQFSPDGDLVATLGTDGTARVWDAATGRHRRTIRAWEGQQAIPVSAEMLSFSPDGSLLAIIHNSLVPEKRGARVWDVGTGKVKLDIPAGFPAHDVAFNPDGTLLALALVEEVEIWDVRTESVRLDVLGLGSNVWDVEWSPDGRRLLTGAGDGFARVFEFTGHGAREAMTLAGHTESLNDVEFSPDGMQVASVSDDGTMRLWDVSPAAGHEVFNAAGTTVWNGDVAFTPNGRYLLATTRPDGLVLVLDARTGEERLRFEGHVAGSGVFGIDVSPDGTKVATASGDGTVKVWELHTGEEIFAYTGHLSSAPETPPGVFDVRFSPDGRLLATASADGTARILNARTGQELHRLDGHRDFVFGLDISPDGTMLATASWDGTVRLWKPSTGRLIGVLDPGEDRRINSVAFSPDGRYLVSVGWDFVVRVWRPATGQQLRSWPAEQGLLFGVAFTPDGQLATGGDHGTIKLWDLSSGNPTLELSAGRRTTFPRLAVSADGRFVASSGSLVRVWILDLDELIRAAWERLTRGFTEDECRLFQIDPCEAHRPAGQVSYPSIEP